MSRSTVSRAAPDPFTSRHPGDVARVVVGLVVLLLASLAVRREQLSQFETDVFRLINDLPAVIEPVLVTIMQAGNVVAAPVLGIVVVFFNRKRLRAVLDVSTAGAVAWFAAKAVKFVVERPRPAGFFDVVAVRPSRAVWGSCRATPRSRPRSPPPPLPTSPGAGDGPSGCCRGPSASPASTSAPTSPSTSSGAPPSAGSSGRPCTWSWGPRIESRS